MGRMMIRLMLMVGFVIPLVALGEEKAAVVARPAIVSAEEWGSKPEPIPAERKHVPKFITIHHAGVLYKAGTDPAKSVRDLQAYGQKEKHWPALPYHFLIAPDGRIFAGR